MRTEHDADGRHRREGRGFAGDRFAGAFRPRGRFASEDAGGSGMGRQVRFHPEAAASASGRRNGQHRLFLFRARFQPGGDGAAPEIHRPHPGHPGQVQHLFPAGRHGRRAVWAGAGQPQDFRAADRRASQSARAGADPENGATCLAEFARRPVIGLRPARQPGGGEDRRRLPDRPRLYPAGRDPRAQPQSRLRRPHRRFS